MSNTKIKAETETNVSIVDQLLNEASINETNKRTLTETEAIKLVDEHYESVSSKNAMLKLLRSLNYSISMTRLFTIYENYTKLKNKLNNETK